MPYVLYLIQRRHLHIFDRESAEKSRSDTGVNRTVHKIELDTQET